MRHSFVYRHVRVDVEIGARDGACWWVCRLGDRVLELSGSAALSGGDALRLAADAARASLDATSAAP